MGALAICSFPSLLKVRYPWDREFGHKKTEDGRIHPKHPRSKPRRLGKTSVRKLDGFSRIGTGHISLKSICLLFRTPRAEV